MIPRDNSRLTNASDFSTISFREILLQAKCLKYRSLKYRFFYSLFPHATLIWRPLSAFLLTEFSSIPRSSSFPSVGRVKRKAPLSLSMDANEAPLAALIERRFTFGRYFINPKRLAARKNLALPYDLKAVPPTALLFLATSRATGCYYRSPALTLAHTSYVIISQFLRGLIRRLIAISETLTTFFWRFSILRRNKLEITLFNENLECRRNRTIFFREITTKKATIIFFTFP